MIDNTRQVNKPDVLIFGEKGWEVRNVPSRAETALTYEMREDPQARQELGACQF